MSASHNFKILVGTCNITSPPFCVLSTIWHFTSSWKVCDAATENKSLLMLIWTQCKSGFLTAFTKFLAIPTHLLFYDIFIHFQLCRLGEERKNWIFSNNWFGRLFNCRLATARQRSTNQTLLFWQEIHFLFKHIYSSGQKWRSLMELFSSISSGLEWLKMNYQLYTEYFVHILTILCTVSRKVKFHKYLSLSLSLSLSLIYIYLYIYRERSK